MPHPQDTVLKDAIPLVVDKMNDMSHSLHVELSKNVIKTDLIFSKLAETNQLIIDLTNLTKEKDSRLSSILISTGNSLLPNINTVKPKQSDPIQVSALNKQTDIPIFKMNRNIYCVREAWKEYVNHIKDLEANKTSNLTY